MNSTEVRTGLETSLATRLTFGPHLESRSRRIPGLVFLVFNIDLLKIALHFGDRDIAHYIPATLVSH